jgi:PAS domain S-box-containing protein
MNEISNTEQIDVLTRTLARERKSKEVAEGFIENRLRELYLNNISLENTLLSKEELQNDFIEDLADAFFIIGFNGDILKVNTQAQKLIGVSKKEMPKNINTFSKINKRNINKLFKQNELENKTVRFNFINKKKVKKYVTIKSIVLINSDNTPYAYQIIARDITTETIREQEYKEQQDVLRFEALIIKDLIVSDNIYNNAWDLVNHIANYLKTDDCVFYGVVNNELVQLAGVKSKLLTEKKLKNILKIKIGQGIVGTVAKTKTGIITNDTSKNKNYIVDDEKRFSEITVPVLLDNELVGVIDAEHHSKHFFNRRQLKILTQISKLISLYLKHSIVELEKSENEIELRKTQSRLEIIFESFSGAQVIESADLRIEQINNAFLKLFHIPLKRKSQFIGMSYNAAAELCKSCFVFENSYMKRIKEIVKSEEVVLNEILELKDGRFLSRDYTPIFHNDKVIAHIWGYKDISLILKYDKSVEIQNIKYKSIIEKLNLGLLELDNKDTIISTNDAFLKMSGYDSEEILGKKAKDFYSTAITKFKNNELQNEAINEIEFIGKNNEEKYWLVSSAPNQDINRNVIGSIHIHLDVSEIKRLKVKADQLIVDLLESNEELSHYAHIVSHDLKTPLRTISMTINWIKEDLKDFLTEDTLEYISTIEEGINDMDQLITSTLRFSEIRSSTEIKDECSLQSSIESIISNINKKAKDDFNVTIVKPLPILKVNEVLVRQIFQNLIENSYKYKKANKKSLLFIDWEEQSESFLFSIKDNGIGIPKKHFGLVFDAHKKLNSRSDSSGLGLFIVKKIITSLGGKIWLESKLGIGTTFYFTLLK